MTAAYIDTYYSRTATAETYPPAAGRLHADVCIVSPVSPLR